MMTKSEKKEMFISIIEEWFDDNTEQIKSDNCIGFYHYLLDCFEFEEKFNKDYNGPELNFIITSIISLLTNFPSYSEERINTKNGLKNFILSQNKNIKLKNFEQTLNKTKELYVLFRDEYLI